MGCGRMCLGVRLGMRQGVVGRFELTAVQQLPTYLNVHGLPSISSFLTVTLCVKMGFRLSPLTPSGKNSISRQSGQ